MARFQRWLKLLGVAAGVVVLALLWGRLDPQTAPVWLVELSRAVTEGSTDAVAPGDPVQIAVAVDGPDRAGPGASVVKGAQLLIEELNARGGIDGAPLEIATYDDRGEIDTAHQIGQQIVAESEAVAVIGHRLTATSLAAGLVYRDAGIPAITPTATHPDITHNNPWLFRTIYDDDHLGRFIAHFVDAVMEPDQVVVVAGSHAYGSNLGEVFTKTAGEIELPVVSRVTIDDEDPRAERVRMISRILELVSAERGRSVVFLATYPEEAVELIRAVRDAGLDEVRFVAPDSFDRPDFASLFDEFPNARRSPGFYTDGIDVATPLLYDTAGRDAGLFRQAYRARFGEDPDWRAAYAYDAAQALVEAIRRSQLRDRNLSLDQARSAVRGQLAAMDEPAQGFVGITGPIFFDPADRDVPRPAAIGRYHGRLLISELTQFKTIRTLGFQHNLRELEQQGQVIDIGGQLMKRVAIVYTGASVREITIDIDAMTFDVVGRIWFRSSETDLEPADIQILNAVGEIEMTELVRQTSADGLSYQRFELAGTFRLDPVPELRQFRRPVVGIAFRHQRSPSQDLIYVVDLRGLGVLPGTPPEDDAKRLAQAIEDQGWQVQPPSIAYPDTQWVLGEGDPAYLDLPEMAVPFSVFVIGTRIVPVGDLFAEGLPRELAGRAFLGGGLVLLLTLALSAFVARGGVALALFILQFLALALMLVAGETLLFEAIEDSVPFQHLDSIAKLFDSAWWLLLALYVVRFLNRFVWPYLEHRTGRAVPRMIKLLCAAIILLLALFGVIAFIYDQPVTSLLATSGLVGLIIGLAVQTNLANVFAGIVLSAEQPFALDDVIEVGDHGIARVTNLTWRTTRLVTPANTEISLPNAVVAEGFIRNYSRASAVKTVVDVWLPPALPIDWVSRTIKAGIEKSARILLEPPPGVEYGGVQVKQNQWAMNYQAYFFVDTPFETGAICSDVSHKIWETLAEAGITRGLGTPGADPEHEGKPSPLASRQS